MLKIIRQWLSKPSGKYFDGLAIFAQLASPQIKNKYLNYFSALKSEPSTIDIHFTMLINQVANIERNVSLNPKAYEHVTLTSKVVEADEETKAVIESKELELVELRKQLKELDADKSDVEDENIEQQETIESLEQGIQTMEEELETLRAKRGIQIVNYNDLPEEIQKLYDRVRVITPLMANIHAEISVEKLHHKTREKLVAQLYKLDDERRAAWDAIDDWSEGKKTETPIVKEALLYSDDKVIAGAQMSRRVESLKENIARSKKTAEAADREVIKENALKRVAAYETELEELLKQITPEPEKVSDVE